MQKSLFENQNIDEALNPTLRICSVHKKRNYEKGGNLANGFEARCTTQIINPL